MLQVCYTVVFMSFQSLNYIHIYINTDKYIPICTWIKDSEIKNKKQELIEPVYEVI